ncbi:MAG: DUF998 domain-containing protein [Candidatus Bathyarchaeia archaeon]
MKQTDGKIAGTLIFVGAVQFILCMIMAECLYPKYSISENYISDLGIGATAPIFNISVFLLGATVAASAYLLKRMVQSKILSVFLTLCGIGAMGVGIFPENFPGMVHTVFSLIAFLFGALSAITSYKIQKPPMSYFAISMGIMSLTALTIFMVGEIYLHYFNSAINLIIGLGGMERMIAYPILLWAIGFGGYLQKSENS